MFYIDFIVSFFVFLYNSLNENEIYIEYRLYVKYYVGFWRYKDEVDLDFVVWDFVIYWEN